MYYVLSVLLGLIPEVLYFTLFISYTKNIKEKRVKLFLLFAIVYFLCVLVQKLQILFYTLLIVLFYIVLKLLYKKKVQIIDIFIISLAYLWIMLLSIAMLFLLNNDRSNYYYLYILDRILLFVPFIFKNNFNLLYKKYCKLWNRNDKEKRPIKSITLRNISLIAINLTIFIANIIIVEIINVGMR